MTSNRYFLREAHELPLPSRPSSSFIVALDLGQAADYSALAVIERIGQADPSGVRASVRQPPHLHCRHLARYPLGTLYPAIVSGVIDLLRKPPLQNAVLLIDATGVGRGICDMFTEKGIAHKRVIVTAGDSVHREGGYWRTPKRDLVSATQAALQDGRLKFAADMPLINVLVQELLNFRVKIDPQTAHDSYNSWREGQHDDLCFALMLATWWALRPPPRVGGSYQG